MSSLEFNNDWVSICNMALGRLGAGSIETLADGTQLANYCNLFLGNVVEDILGGHDWRALRKRVELAPLVSTPLYDFDHVYQLPSDFVRIIDVDNDDEEYSIETDELLTDADEVAITYIYCPGDDLTAVPGYVKKAIASELAYQLSIELRSSESTSQRVLAEATRDLQKAKQADARKNQNNSRADDIGYTYTEEVR
jgi:hypothetical protein